MNKKDIKQIEIENNKLITKLDKDNYRAYDNISIYLDLDDEIDLSKKIIKNDIVKMIYEGQVRGQSWDEIIGDDYKKFADEVISTRKNLDKKARLIYTIRNILGGINIILGLYIIIMLFEGYDFRKTGIAINRSMLPIMMLVIIGMSITSNMNITRSKKRMFSFIFAFLVTGIFQILNYIYKGKYYIDYKLFFLLFIITIILFIIISVVYSKEKMNLIN